MIGYSDMNVQSSNIKIQSVDWYHLHDCAMVHQHFIFQESECWCPLKEDVKVDDGLGKLAFWKPKSNLTQAQNELSAFTLIFFIILFVNMRYAPLSFSGIAAHIIQYLFPLVIGTSSLVYSDAPTSSTASTRSVILFNIHYCLKCVCWLAVAQPGQLLVDSNVCCIFALYKRNELFLQNKKQTI